MRFASLGSGSSGNATVVAAGDTHVLIDCGFSLREAGKRLARLGLDVRGISAILVTHEHTDHSKGVASFAERLGTPVYMTQGTRRVLRGWDDKLGYNPIEAGSVFRLGELQVAAVPVPHDAGEPVQFVFRHNGLKLGVLTDLGSLTPRVIQAYDGCHGLLLEANYDPDLLASGPYPYFLQRRISGRLGHLSNEQAVELLLRLDTSQLRQLVMGHLSRKNNTLAKVQAALARVTKPIGQIAYACQDGGFDWRDLDPRTHLPQQLKLI